MAIAARQKHKLTISRFDAADYLDRQEVILEYLSAAVQDGNPQVFLQAVADVAKARGVVLDRVLFPGSTVEFNTVRRVLDSLGVSLTVKSGGLRK